jgi:hypothetical protein
MDIICKSRAAGKTTEAIKVSAATGSYIVCLGREEAHRIFNRALELKIQIPFPMTFNELLTRRFYPPEVRGLVIDQADTLLTFIARGIPITAITLSHEPQPTIKTKTPVDDPDEKFTEIAVDEQGNLIWEKPYPFRRLFRKGQEQVVDSVAYTTISCVKDGNIIRTVLRRA